MDTKVIWNDFSESLKRFIHSRVNDHDVVDDMLQNVFIKIHLNIHKIKKQESIKSWVFTITNRVIIDYYKSQSKKIANIITTLESNDENSSEHSAADCLLTLINNLPPSYKEALMLSEIKGLKQAEIAKILNISLSGAKSRIQRGRSLLKQGFIDCCNYKLNKEGYLVGDRKSVV